MRSFTCRPFGDVVDLDDPKTYDHLPEDVEELRTLMLSKIGYAYCYINFWHPYAFKGSEQENRVNLLVSDFTENEGQNYNNPLWYKEKIFLFQDEIENMC
jgi:hypothetical protein